MALFSKGGVNMDGSEDPFYRYTMPAILVKPQGETKMRKTVLVNLEDVCAAIGRPTHHLLAYLGQRFSAATSGGEKNGGKAYISGAHSEADVQQYILGFIREAVMCRHCGVPETSCVVEGRKKKREAILRCKACGKPTELDSTDRFVKFMIAHAPPDTAQGHAGAIRQGGTSAVLAAVTALADGAADEAAVEVCDDPEPTADKKKRCPTCGHKTAKTSCKKCGAKIRTESPASTG
jgi:translation initiation factor 2 beta subunit (eIF-2beta)/eIF-5